MALIPLESLPVDLRHQLGLKSAADIAADQKKAKAAIAKTTEAALIEKLGNPVSINNEEGIRTLVYDDTKANLTEFEIKHCVVAGGMYRSVFIYDPTRK